MQIPECGLEFCLLGKCLSTLTGGNWKGIIKNYLWNLNLSLALCHVLAVKQKYVNAGSSGKKAGTGNIRKSECSE